METIIAIVILVLLLIVYITNMISPVVATLLALVAMTYTGIISPAEAFDGFGSTATMLIIGMNIVGAAFFTTGISAALGRFLYSKSHGGGMGFTMICCLLGFVMSMFINAMAVISIFMPVIDSVEAQSEGKIQRKYVYLPMAIACVYGGLLTSVSASATVTANGLLYAATGESFSFLQPAILTAPGALAMFIILPTIGYRIMQKVFDFEPIPLPTAASTGSGTSDQSVDKKKATILVAVLLLSICGFAFTNLNIGLIALTAAAVLMLTSCITVHDAIGKVNWSTVILLSAGMGVSVGLQNSGVADLLANVCINIGGNNAFLLCAIVLVFTTLLSNFMANTNAVLIVAPIAISMAQSIGADVLPFMLAIAVGAGMSVSTLISTAAITITSSLGYRMKDYMAYGGVINLTATVLGVAMLKIFFF